MSNHRDGQSMTAYATLANAVTACSMLAGLAALYVTIRSPQPMPPPDAALACGLVAAAAALDAADGPVARATTGATAFGARFDSLADLSTGGPVTAVILWWTLLSHGAGPAGPAVAALWVICAGMRLARFEAAPPRHGWFAGLPVPAAAVAGTVIAAARPLPAPWTAAVIAVIAVQMAATAPFPAWPTLLGLLTFRKEPAS